MAKRTARFAFVVFLPSIVTAQQTGPPVSVRDSAGIQIVENRAPVYRSGEFWRVGAQPSVAIGEAEGDSAYQFYRIFGVTRLRDGSIVVLNSGSAQLRLYDRSGKHKRTVGRRGEGPGEFEFPAYLGRGPGDTIVVSDVSAGPLSYFAPDLTFVRQQRLDRAELARRVGPGKIAGAAIPLGDGSILIEFELRRQGAAPPPATLYNRPLGFYRAAPDLSRMDSLGWFRGISELYLDISPMRHYQTPLFEMRGTVVSGGAPLQFYAGDGSSNEVLQLTPSGRVQRIVRRLSPLRPIPAESAQAERAWRVTHAYPRTTAVREGAERTLAALPKETHFPAYRELLVDAAGNLWLRDDQWLVFDTRGRWLGMVALPRDFRLIEVGMDYVLGVHQDSLQVERVLLYPLDRRTGRR